MSEVWTKIKQTVDTSVSDREYVAEFEREVGVLTGLVLEAVEQNPGYLLSPIMRGLLVEKAKRVATMLAKLSRKLVCDNPLENLS